MTQRSYDCPEDRFLKDVARHELTVLRDDGVNRHIRFRRSDESAYWFDLITWPGALCIDGDMGTYVFKRLHDMFEFFRTDREYMTRHGNKLAINPGYWDEKLVAPNCRDAQEFSAAKFRQKVKEAFDDWVESNQPDKEYSTKKERDDFNVAKDELWTALHDDVLSVADDGDTRAYDAARDFSCNEAISFNMSDCWEWNCREYKFHFIWCCYAIAWGVQAYDQSKGGAA